ncbi:hypothetical protein AB723_19345, partial [Acinetobacter baumannii]
MHFLNAFSKCLELLPAFFIMGIPVSYTHLDVYKRQEQECKKEVLKRLKHDAGNEIISVKFGSEVKERRS